LPNLFDPELLQVFVALELAPFDETSAQEILVFSNRLRAQFLGADVLQEQVNGLSDVGNIWLLDDADLTRGFPIAH
jgi:hypothetical protein